ncbi:hypothetical protein SAMN05428975_1317 [Mucilaginibacter sp. OK268]|jgi:hypothetical protein|nr:hypothetical protein SAMN05428975_1317 [Mucilaginibacter sp. OK268]
MSLFFFDEIFFLKTVVLYIMATVAKVIQHSLNGSGAAAEAGGRIIYGAEPVLSDQFQDVIKPLLIRSVVHSTRSQIGMSEFGGLGGKML